MSAFNPHSEMQNLIQIFNLLDKKHLLFVKKMEKKLYDFVTESKNSGLLSDRFNQQLRPFVISLINATYSILEKDQHYPKYRMEIELKSHRFLLKQYPKPKIDNQQYARFARLIKKGIVDNFNQIYDLSANGFRLLEQSLSYHINVFIASILPES